MIRQISQCWKMESKFKTDVEHDNGEFFLNGERLNANNLSTFALFSTVQLLKNGILRADFSGSRTVFATKLQNVGLTADHQEIRVIGGVRGISVETDDFLFEVGYTNEPLQLVGFVLPDDFIRPMGRFEENINVISTFPSPTHINYTNDKDCFGITYPTSDFSTKTILTTPIWEDFNNVTVTPSYQESSTFNSISDFSTDSTYTVGLTEDFTTLPLSTETTTTSYPSTATIESSSIPIFPLPSNFSTDGFVIGHWFTTEKSRLETTTMPSQIAFTATIQNIDLSTKENAVNTDIPQPNDLNLNVDMTKPSTTNAPVLYTTEIEELFPNPSPLPDLKNKTEKMFILKLKIPEEIDEKSVQLLKNLTSSMKRLA
uniref:Uncharacterized protein n=2 Tax=Caenorhabditis japonica TaxID=281687 RepID=A0A8R1I164_CAEJA